MRAGRVDLVIIFSIIISTVKCSIKSCHLSDPNTTLCYQENIVGMLNIFKRMKNKPDPMNLDKIFFNQILNEDGEANIVLNNATLHNIINAEVDKVITEYDGAARKFIIDVFLKCPDVSKSSLNFYFYCSIFPTR